MRVYATIGASLMQGIDFIFAVAVLVVAVIIHEVSHGYAAYMLGDPTAKYAGRLTLNPMKHLDPMGSFVVPLFLFLIRAPILLGWAKPVPYNPHNIKNKKWGPAMVGVAGPLSNFLVAGVFGFLSTLIPLSSVIKTQAIIGMLQGVTLQGESYLVSLFSFCLLIVLINLVLAVFNLIPIPPLDGSKVLYPFLPFGLRQRLYFWGKEMKVFFMQYWIYILVFFFLFGHRLLEPIFAFVFYVVRILFLLFIGVGF